jgi:crotonobetainyl-CoA:carnitine CoA-transferase CaiB-like acyl-CoA transferase
MGKQTRAHWIAKLEAVGVPCGSVNSIAEAFTHPHTIAREMVVDIGDAKSGPVKTVGCPIKLSRTNSKVASLAPHLGEHTREVLLESGLDEKEIDDLAASGAVLCAN